METIGLVVEEIWVFELSRNYMIEMSRDILGGAPLSWVSTLPSFKGHEPFKYGDKTFLICGMTTWPMCHVTLWVGSTHHLVTTLLSLGLISPVKAEIKCLSFVKWSLYWNVTWLFGWVLLILSHWPATFGVHRLYGSGDDGVFNISSNFNPRFINGQYMR